MVGTVPCIKHEQCWKKMSFSISPSRRVLHLRFLLELKSILKYQVRIHMTWGSHSQKAEYKTLFHFKHYCMRSQQSADKTHKLQHIIAAKCTQQLFFHSLSLFPFRVLNSSAAAPCKLNLLKAWGRTLASSDITALFGQDTNFQIVSNLTFGEGFSKVLSSEVSRLLSKGAVTLALTLVGPNKINVMQSS